MTLRADADMPKDRAIGSRARTLLGECVASAIVVFGVFGAGLAAAPLDSVPAFGAVVRTFAVGAVVASAVWTFGPATGAQVHPLLTAASMLARSMSLRDGPVRLLFQAIGACAGAFAVRLVPVSAGPLDNAALSAVLVRELVLALILLLVAWRTARSQRAVFPAALGIVSALAYWLAGSTSTAHPFVLLMRPLVTGEMSGLGRSALGVGAQVFGTIAGTMIAGWLFQTSARVLLTYGRRSK